MGEREQNLDASRETGRNDARRGGSSAGRHGAARLANAAVFAVLAVLLGVPIGVVAWLFMLVMQLTMHLVWGVVPQLLGIATPGAEASGATAVTEPLLPFWFILAVTIVGAVLLAANERRNERRGGIKIVPIMQAIMQVKKGRRYDWRKTGDYALTALLPLTFGAAVGPEAGLTNVIAAAATRVGDTTKALAVTCRACVAEGRAIRRSEVRAALRADGGPGVPSPFASRVQKRVAYGLIAAGATATFFLLGHLVGGGLTLPRLPGASWSVDLLLWALPCVVAGVVCGILFDAFSAGSARLARAFGRHVLVRNLAVALVLSCAGAAIPCVLFSGETDLFGVVEGWQEFGLATLLAMVVCRLALAPLCIACGWEGGQFFPLIFAGVVAGYAVAMLTGADPTFCAACSSAALLGTIMRRPLLAVATMLLVMPLPMAVPMVLAGWVGAVVPLPKALGAAPAKRLAVGRRGAEPRG